MADGTGAALAAKKRAALEANTRALERLLERADDRREALKAEYASAPTRSDEELVFGRYRRLREAMDQARELVVLTRAASLTDAERLDAVRAAIHRLRSLLARGA